MLLLSTAYIVNNSWKKPLIHIAHQERKNSLKPEFYNLVHMGQRRLISSLLWVDTLLASDLDHYKGADLSNWMYIRFDTITDLDPFFIQAYQNGGLILSVVKDDDLGAIKLYQKGLKLFPKNYQLLYYAGTHALLELQDLKLAMDYLEQVKDSPKKPPFLPSLLSKLKINQGDISGAYDILLKAYQKEKNNHLRQYFAKTLYAIKSEKNLHCLNSLNKKLCDKKDFEGNFYLLAPDGKYHAPKKWSKARLKVRNK